jgi:succinylglutamate desuccinylase
MEATSPSTFLALSREQATKIKYKAYTLSNHTKVIIHTAGVIEFVPANYSKNIILSCGIHGNETAPIEICDALVQQILGEELVLRQRVMFIFGNLPSMDIEKRFVEENLNRLFAKDIEQTNQERERAHLLMQLVDAFFETVEPFQQRIHYDLHTAIRDSKNEKFLVYPYLYGREYSKEQLAFMSACGVNTVLLSQGPTNTFSHYSSKYHHAHAFTVELGKVKRFGENDMSRFEQTRKMLLELMTQDIPNVQDFEKCPIEIFEVAQEIIKTKDDFELHFDDHLANFSEFKKGELIASESGKSYYAMQDSEAIVFPNAKVAIGQRALLTVIPCDI